MKSFNLRDGVQPQTYGLGIKEVRQLPRLPVSPSPCLDVPYKGRQLSRLCVGSGGVCEGGGGRGGSTASPASPCRPATHAV